MGQIEILPPQASPDGGMTYRANLYTKENGRVSVTATVSPQLRAKMARVVQRSAAWVAAHVRIPHHGLGDLMAGSAPDCGCDAVGDAFRTGCLRVSDLLAEYELGELDAELGWSFDDWDGAEPELVPDIEIGAYDLIGASVSRRPSRLPIVVRALPGSARLAGMFAAALGHV